MRLPLDPDRLDARFRIDLCRLAVHFALVPRRNSAPDFLEWRTHSARSRKEFITSEQGRGAQDFPRYVV